MGEVEAAGRLVEEEIAGAAVAGGRASWTRARARWTRCCSPPDKRGAVARRERGKADAVERLADERVGLRARDMRREAEPHHLVDAEGEGDAHRLGEHRAHARQGRPRATRRCRGHGA